ncbi:hypothetical protein MKK75_31140 [Methylobacterium sp. J-030]|uniref:hypothetical protein n=1 Tax=Methylobacterium sp. J-030 TaxID=2836627 RepID=UPI001FBBB49A|nr:hypothetical protein [Methylobacterium sp. J-030]MCJ2073189.1 hypothetical protein [Methylobacterium sp. J-030]
MHKGEHWGRANQFAMLAFCLPTMLLAATAGTMWWKRRPPGGLGVPSWPWDPRPAARRHPHPRTHGQASISKFATYSIRYICHQNGIQPIRSAAQPVS